MNSSSVARFMYVTFAINGMKSAWAHDKTMMIAMAVAIVIIALVDIVFEGLRAEDERKRQEARR